MTIQTKVRADNAGIITLSGRDKAARELAFLNIAPLAFVETKSRTSTIDNLRVALGAKPTDKELRTAKVEWIIGRVASRLGGREFPKLVTETMDRMEIARDLVCFYAVPPKEGTKANKLRHGQKGRRSAVQHKVIRAAEEAWSQVKAELGLGAAQTQAQRNAAKKTRAPAAAGSTARGKNGKAPPPTHSALVTPDKPMSADEAHAHIVTQMTALLAYVNKHSKLIETGFSMPVIECQKAVVRADAERRVRKTN